MKNEVMDRRVKLTIMILQNALIDSMQTKHISKISVKVLCEMADINRSTFYAHFKDSYDLLEYTCKESISKIKQYLDKQQPKDNKPISYHTLIRILDYAKENSKLFKALLSDNCDLDLQRNIINEFLVYPSNEALDDRTKKYLSSFGLAGCVSMLQIWLKDGMPESTTRMAEIILQAIDQGITAP